MKQDNNVRDVLAWNTFYKVKFPVLQCKSHQALGTHKAQDVLHDRSLFKINLLKLKTNGQLAG